MITLILLRNKAKSKIYIFYVLIAIILILIKNVISSENTRK